MSVSCAVRHYGGDIADAAEVRAWEGNWLCNGIVIGSAWVEAGDEREKLFIQNLIGGGEKKFPVSILRVFDVCHTNKKKTEPSNPQEWLWWNTLINDVWCGFTNYTENFHIFQDLESFFFVCFGGFAISFDDDGEDLLQSSEPFHTRELFAARCRRATSSNYLNYTIRSQLSSALFSFFFHFSWIFHQRKKSEGKFTQNRKKNSKLTQFAPEWWNWNCFCCYFNFNFSLLCWLNLISHRLLIHNARSRVGGEKVEHCLNLKFPFFFFCYPIESLFSRKGKRSKSGEKSSEFSTAERNIITSEKRRRRREVEIVGWEFSNLLFK